ncbi:MAG: NapC/NirT family cytochrome c [Euryarchaeota archaeon]|nr:NapC/NirT family cytochrome c [Euryarchaeota archaeon]
MKKWLIPALLLVAASAYASSVAFRSLNDPLFCADCHVSEYKNYLTPINNSDLPAHKENNITCIECHSPEGMQGNLAAKRVILNVVILNKTYPSINRLFSSNYSFNQSFNASDFIVLKADCIKCHDVKKLKTLTFNHSNASACEKCHLLHTEPEKPEVSFWKRMGEGGHNNLTCGGCHGTDVTRLEELPQCTKCHSTHLKGAQWDRSVCLGCHNDPHLPIKKAAFSGTLTKEMCASCHNNIYQVLTIYDSKHNKNVPSCVNCHPVHREAKTCMDCHTPHGQHLHPGSRCGDSCHGLVRGCTGCHTNPHAPLSGLPRITGGEQWREYASQAGKI